MTAQRRLSMFIEPVDRREFTLRSALALLAGVTITITGGCGGGGGGYNSGGSPTQGTPPPANNSQADAVGSISNNHGHSAVITSAQLVAGSALSLDIRGSADHSHTVQLTPADLVNIRSMQAVSKDCSTSSAHMHVVTFARGGEPPGPGY
jgi:hypothetical protein